MPIPGANYTVLADSSGDLRMPQNSSSRRAGGSVAQSSRYSKWYRLLYVFAFVLVFVASWIAAEVRLSLLFEPDSLTAVWKFARSLFPPDFSISFLRTVLIAVGQTLAIAIAGTFLSIVIGLPLGIMSTATLWRRGILMAGERRSLGTQLLAAVSRFTLALLGFLRAVPDLVWGLLFVVAVGLGSLPGTLAIAVSYGGVLGRVYADVFEEVDARPLEALHAMGASRAQVFLRAIFPQAAPSIVAYTLYSFECCLRAASVLGFVGAGGIGYEINISMRLFEYGQVLTLIIAFILLLAVNDALSRSLRRRLHGHGVTFRAGARQRVETAMSDAAHRENVGAGAAIVSDDVIRQTSRVEGINGPGGRIVRSHKHPTGRIKPIAVISLFILVLTLSFYGSGFANGALGDVNLLMRIGRFVLAMFPPDTNTAFLLSLVKPLSQTIGISIIGTLVGVIIGALLAIPATSTLIFPEPNQVGRRSHIVRLSGFLVYTTARLLLNALRSIPELVWVLICILAVGLGPFAGTLALGLHTGGVLGKLYAETFEEAPGQAIEAMRAGGARPLQILIWGILPQVRLTLVSYTVLRWEMNLRVSTILGLVGGGGLGQAIYNNVQLGFYPRLLTLITIIYLLVLIADWIGARIRVNFMSA